MDTVGKLLPYTTISDLIATKSILYYELWYVHKNTGALGNN